MPETNDDLEREFDALIARTGATVPADRRAGCLVGYEDLKRMCALLRQERGADSEPANVYSLDVILRGS